jgi:hypothetical protein
MVSAQPNQSSQLAVYTETETAALTVISQLEHV